MRSWEGFDCGSSPPSLSLSLTFLQLTALEPTVIDISAHGLGFAICQVCVYMKLTVTFPNDSLLNL